ncbi:VanZ family protein [Limnobacter sp.]|uniref:VanZ family protein n=1 Tax=Limnobacter sp. TaxID=2003368 RepID=UPI0025831734|nr:VanZ family protein [Limnobacter sp.]
MNTIHHTLAKNRPYQGIMMAAWMYAFLIVHLSLYPYSDWRNIGIGPFEFLWGPWIPVYQTVLWSDIGINIAGYMPLGMLLTVGLNLKNRKLDQLGAFLACALLSLSMEAIQTYLPSRVPSKMDLLTNALGGLIGVVIAGRLMEKRAAVARINQRIEHWLIDRAWLGMAILGLWFLSILAPQNPAFGTGLWLGNLIDPNSDMVSGTLFGLPGSLILWIENAGPDLINYCFLMCAWMIGLAQTQSGAPRTRLLVVLVTLTIFIRLLDSMVANPPGAWLYQINLWFQQNWEGLLAAILIGALVALVRLSHRTLARVGIIHLLAGWATTALIPGVYSPDIDTHGSGMLRIFFVLQDAGRWVSEVWPLAALAVLTFIAKSKPHFRR